MPSGRSGSSHGSGGGGSGGGFGSGPHGWHVGNDGSRFYGLKLLVFTFASLFLLIAGFVIIKSCNSSLDNNNKSTDMPVTISASADIQTENSEIYVEEIGRTCKWDSEYESYYDKTTDCYFWKNDTIDPPQWQYWYEDISSDYGDYGWMEYDFDEKIWYIEVSDDRWEPLPEKYDTTELWHFSTI